MHNQIQPQLPAEIILFCGKELFRLTIEPRWNRNFFILIPSRVNLTVLLFLGYTFLMVTQYLSLAVIFRPEPEGGFTVTVPSLPGCITYGKNLTEAHRMVEEAITLYLQAMIAEGEALPEDTSSYLTELKVKVPSRRTALHA